MNKISYKSSTGMVGYGLIATLICNNTLGERAFMVPEIQCEFKTEISGISGPMIHGGFYPTVHAETELERSIGAVMEILTRNPSSLDLEMLGMMDEDIWELF